MTITRREHLKQLGLGAVGIFGAGPFGDLIANQALTFRRDSTSTATVDKLKARNWPWTSSTPSDHNPGIRLVFAGMMVFTYKQREGRVVFDRSAHDLQIVVLRSDGCVQTDIEHLPPDSVIRDIPPGAIIDLVIPQRHYNDVVFFQTGDHDDFNRAAWDDKDFRWMLDLEGPESFNDKDFNRNENNGFDTKLRVQSGRFYTYQRTNSTFTADVGTLKGETFNVAKVMACDLWLADAETLLLKIPGKPVRTMQNPAKYEIYFLNVPTCNPCATEEFSMVFDAIEDGQSYKFDLKLKDEGSDEVAPGLCVKIGGPRTRFTDKAPCMGAGFGGGNGFP